jgi:lipopolysaccharide/colanic/teichoic acid biosynthesis glycosyltransferase
MSDLLATKVASHGDLQRPEAWAKAPEKFGEASRTRRIAEAFLAAIILVLSLPLMLLIALAIRIDSPGPVLFFQQRLGKDGKQFRFVKFRTLYADARTRFPELYTYRYSPEDLTDLKFKIDDDPRVTRRGAWLRKTSLDELPNFWNVVTGDMALVGPRPEIPEMLPYYRGEMLRKFSVRPGVTGPAQISGRGRLKFYDTVQFDLEYVHKRSLRYDAKVLYETVLKVVAQDGAF